MLLPGTVKGGPVHGFDFTEAFGIVKAQALKGVKTLLKRNYLAAVAGSLLWGPAPAAAELAKTQFYEWTARCNSDNYCIAETAGTGTSGEAFRLKIERGAKPGSPVYVTFKPVTKLETGMTARIEVSSGEENYGFFGKAGKIYKGNEMTFSGAADRPLVENLRLGSTAAVQIEFGGSAGTKAYTVSLKGITQALLKIDDAQGRIGRGDAIVAWGGLAADSGPHTLNGTAPQSSDGAVAKAPAEAAPAVRENAAAADDLPPPVMPSQDVANNSPDTGNGMVYDLGRIPDSVQMMGYRTLDCRLDEVVPAFGARVIAEGDVELWIVPCQMADANVPYYMATHIPFNPSLDEWQEFETPPGFNQPNHALVNNLVYDTATGQVTGTTYYSPNYDCGSFERHEMEAESGQYILIEYLEKTNCDGIQGPAEGWPLSWTIDEMGQ
ncbi:hypothetical protein GCM10009077_11710 [Roseibium denhamense]|uniref:DUF1176 domain-containing protein n=2 Tax=Roseibium denhamense TaxID=76305 RepID=A0ABY1NFD1_9HYPH|nr:DUF1176 domain-containing protein [Roseibium denhamense]SMP07809.1 Protein of unknown function [Roseibium denhamense]